jgi:molecular chaperone Hsp33
MSGNPHVYKFHTKDGFLRISAVKSTQIVREMTDTLGLSAIASVGLGRLTTGTILMASQLNDGQSLSIRVHGDGPIGHLVAEASFEGKVRGYCQKPDVQSVDVKEAIGKGFLSVARTMPFQKEPQIGIVNLRSGEIGEDLAYYMHQSQQVPTIISLAVSLDKEGSVAQAGGVLIELMPDAPEKVIAALEKNTKEAPPLSQQLSAGASERTMVESYVHSKDLVETQHPFPVQYFCPCTIERVERTLTMLGRESLSDFLKKNKPVGVKCEFCKKDYTVTLARIQELLFDLETPN